MHQSAKRISNKHTTEQSNRGTKKSFQNQLKICEFKQLKLLNVAM